MEVLLPRGHYNNLQLSRREPETPRARRPLRLHLERPTTLDARERRGAAGGAGSRIERRERRQPRQRLSVSRAHAPGRGAACVPRAGRVQGGAAAGSRTCIVFTVRRETPPRTHFRARSPRRGALRPYEELLHRGFDLGCRAGRDAYPVTIVSVERRDDWPATAISPHTARRAGRHV